MRLQGQGPVTCARLIIFHVMTGISVTARPYFTPAVGFDVPFILNQI